MKRLKGKPDPDGKKPYDTDFMDRFIAAKQHVCLIVTRGQYGTGYRYQPMQIAG